LVVLGSELVLVAAALFKSLSKAAMVDITVSKTVLQERVGSAINAFVMNGGKSTRQQVSSSAFGLQLW
jgi:hypothetical protein